jgi:hypothetical protein
MGAILRTFTRSVFFCVLDQNHDVIIFGVGYVQPKAKAKSPLLSWDETKASSQVTTPVTFRYLDSTQWRFGEYVIAQSGDKCAVGSWVFVRHDEVQIINSISNTKANKTIQTRKSLLDASLSS